MLGALDDQRGEKKKDRSLQQPEFRADEKLLNDPAMYCQNAADAFYMDFPTFNNSQNAYTAAAKEVTEVNTPVQESLQGPSSVENTEWDDAKERKKAQNRAAQKAFRERKEIRLRELEEKLEESEENRRELTEKIKFLKQQNQQQSNMYYHDGLHNISPQTYTFPSQREFYDTLVAKEIHGELKENEDRYLDDSGKETLPIAAAWEYLHDLLSHKDFDIYAVMQSLQGREVCHGHGAAYPKALIDRVVEDALNGQ